MVYAADAAEPDVVFVIAGTRRLLWVWRQRRSGAVVVHRLDGLHWRLRRLPRDLKPRLTNYLVRLIRRHLADAVVYQSDFVRSWWEDRYGAVTCPTVIIHNGAPPAATADPLPRQRSVVCVEGNYHDDATTRAMVAAAAREAPVTLVGAMSETLAEEFRSIGNVEVLGRVDRDAVSRYLASATVYLCLELNAPCPNSVVEALMAGVPVVGYATGALPELVPPNGGVLVEYLGDPWKLDVRDHRHLGVAVREALDGAERMRAVLMTDATSRRLHFDETCRAYLAFLAPVVRGSRADTGS